MNLEHLKVGDKVMITDSFRLTYSVKTIDRVTKTQIICGNTKIKRVDGYEIGSGQMKWSPSTYWKEYDVAQILKIKESTDMRKLDRARKVLKNEGVYDKEMLTMLLKDFE